MDDLMRDLKKKTDLYSKNYDVQAQRTMRLAAEKVHGVFQELKPGTLSITIVSVLGAIEEAIDSFGDMLQDGAEDSSEYLLIEG